MQICLNDEFFHVKTLYFWFLFKYLTGRNACPCFIPQHSAQGPPQKHQPRPNGALSEKWQKPASL